MTNRTPRKWPRKYSDEFRVEREGKVLVWREQGYTFEKIAKILGVTRERVRQIFARAQRLEGFSQRHGLPSPYPKRDKM